MNMPTSSAHQLTEYFTAVTASADEDTAIAVAVERAVEMVGAEAGAVVLGEEVRGDRGFGADAPVEGLLALADAPGTLSVPSLGDRYAVSSPPSARTWLGALVLARESETFGEQERQILDGLAQGLGLALRSIRVLRGERTVRVEREREAADRLVLLEQAQTRRQLVESLLAIQREISSRKSLPEILDAVTSGTGLLLGGVPVALILAEAGRDRRLTVASTSGAGDHDFVNPEGPQTEARVAMSTSNVIMRAAVPGHPERGTILAAPVRVTGEMSGSLVAQLPSTPEASRELRDLLAAFAQQVSLALTDARTVEAVHEAHHDSVTGLPNRGLFLKISNRVLAARGEPTEPTSVLFIDLDRFKAVNDSLGHEAGDELLASVADRIRGCVRASDTTARLGGDEFAVLLHDSPVESATAIGERVIAAIKEPFRISGRDVFIGASVGVAASREPSADSKSLLNKADLAMYRAKKAWHGPGRGLRAAHAHRGARLPEPARRPPVRDARGPVPAPVPAPGPPGHGRDRRRGGARTLAQPDPRPGDADRLHPDRRGVGPDRGDRPVGAEVERDPGGGLAPDQPRSHAQRERLGASAPARAVRRERDPGAGRRRDARRAR
nr:hypothetical protein GCM10020092_005510 [Actinoplanes digitatis]